MTALFVSHASADNEVTGRLTAWLEQAGFAARFVDFDPEVGIPAGRLWERELFAQLTRCDGLVFVASPASLASQWCFAELAMARSQSKPIFPVQVEAGVRHRLLDDVQGVDATGDEAGGFARLVAGLEAAGLRAADSFAWDGSRPPYPGLAAFDVADAAVFFGRDGEVRRLLERLAPAGIRGADRSIAVVGPSGSGKSSLVRAGLLPRLARQHGGWVVLGPLLPGERPVVSLARALAGAFASRGRVVDRHQVEAELAGGQQRLVELLRDLCQLAGGDQMRVLLAVDQAEELLTPASELERGRFFELLEPSVRLDGLLWVVATLRTEALDRFAADETLAGLVDEPMVIGRLPRGRLAQVIARPAQRAGLQFEAGLVDRMVDDTVGGDALPLLGYTLRELSERAELGQQITHADYDELGGVIGALQKQADRVTETLTRQGAGEAVLPTLLRLTTIDPGGEPTRRRVPYSQFTGHSHAVIQAFVDARLLVTASHEDTTTVEVAHEALLRQWPPLRQAIEASRHELELRADLERQARDWDNHGRDESYLLRGVRLAEVEELGDVLLPELGGRELEFVAASRAHAATEIEQARLANRRLRRLTLGLAGFLILTVSAGAIAWTQQRIATVQEERANARMLVAQATALRLTQPAAATTLALAAWRLTDIPDTRSAVLETLAHPRAGALLGQPNPSGVAISPDGRLLVGTGWNGSVEVWDLATHRQLSPLDTAGARGFSFSPRFSADGSVLATAHFDGTVRLWDMRTARPLTAPIPVGDEGAGRETLAVMALSPDASTLAVAAQDGTVRMIDVMTGSTIHVGFEGHGESMRAMAFSPDGTILATADDSAVRLWDVTQRRQLGETLQAAVPRPPLGTTLAFRSDGKMIAVAEGDRVLLVNVASGAPVGEPLDVGGEAVHGLAFSPDGAALATAGRDGAVRLWDVTERRQLQVPLTGHGDRAWDVAFTPDGGRLAVAGDQGRLLLWEMTTRAEAHTTAVDALAISPDGSLLASVDSRGAVHLWDMLEDQLAGTWTVPVAQHFRTEPVRAVRAAWSPDSELLAISAAGGDVWLADVAGLQAPTRLTSTLFGSPPALAFDPSGPLLAVAAGSSVQIWDLTTRQETKVFASETDRGTVSGLAFTPDGQALVTSSFTLRIWDVAAERPTERAISTPQEGHGGGFVPDVAISSDGQLVASSGRDRTVRLWSLPTGELIDTLVGHTDAVEEVAFAPDSHDVISVGQEGTVRFWRGTSDSQEWVAEWSLSGRAAQRTAAVAPSSGLLASGDAAGAITVWDLDIERVAADICALGGDPLPAEEWQTILPDLTYQTACH